MGSRRRRQRSHAYNTALNEALTLFRGLNHGGKYKELKFPSGDAERRARRVAAAFLMTKNPPRRLLDALAASLDFGVYRRWIAAAIEFNREAEVKEFLKEQPDGLTLTVIERGGLERQIPDPGHERLRRVISRGPWRDWYPEELQATSYRSVYFKRSREGRPTTCPPDPNRDFKIALRNHAIRKLSHLPRKELAKRFFPNTEKESALRQIQRILKTSEKNPYFDFDRHQERRAGDNID